MASATFVWCAHRLELRLPRRDSRCTPSRRASTECPATSARRAPPAAPSSCARSRIRSSELQHALGRRHAGAGVRSLPRGRTARRQASLILVIRASRRPSDRLQFSRSASQRAASLLAPCSESMYTDAPVMLRSRIESACTETEDVRLRIARADHAVAQNDEVVVIANQVRAHARLGVDALRQRARDREHDVFFHTCRCDRSSRGPCRRGPHRLRR